MDFFNSIPDIFIQFLVVLFFSLLIGLEQRQVQTDKEGPPPLFGTDRTYTFIGIFGFILYILDVNNLILFLAGAFLLSFLLPDLRHGLLQRIGQMLAEYLQLDIRLCPDQR